MKDKICVFEKFGFCRNGSSCKFSHPTLVCDDHNCNIQECSKRHPQACRFFTSYKYCKYGDSCKFLHVKKPDDKINKEEYITLKEKYDVLENKYSKLKEKHDDLENKYSNIQDRVVSLEKNFFDLMRNEIHNIHRDANQMEIEDPMVVNKHPSPNNFVKRKADIDDLQLEEKRNKMGDVTIVSDDDDMEEDEEDELENSCFHAILDYEYDISKYLTHEIEDIRDNLKGRIIDVTIKKLNVIKDTIVDKRNELKNMNGQFKHLESESVSGMFSSDDSFKVMDDFIRMVEYLEKLPKNKFRNIADKDLTKILDDIDEVERNKESNLHLIFNGPKYQKYQN